MTYACFIDFTKELDRVKHDKLFDILKKTGFGDNYLKIITNLYWRQKVSVKGGGELYQEQEIRGGV